MKVRLEHDLLCIDVKTKSSGGSATNQYVDDPNTEVYYGNLHACVTLKDVGIEVIMDPDPGEWSDAAWARARAWKVVCERLTPTAFAECLGAARAQGQAEGAERARFLVREALGLEAP